MQVLFDLRPQHLVKLQSTKVDVVRLFSILLLSVFVLLSIYNLIFIGSALSAANNELASKQSELSSLSANNNRLQASLKTMRELRDRTKAYMELIRADIPTVEFLSALEMAVTEGLKISNIEMRQGGVTMKGAALADQDIIDFGERLASARYIVRKVDAPVTTRGNQNNKDNPNMQPNFTVSCAILSLAEIADNETQLAAPAAGGEGESEAGTQ